MHTMCMCQNITRMEYYINSDPGFGNGIGISGYSPSNTISSFNFNLNASAAEKGFNIAYIRAQDDNGNWSLTNKIPFLKTSLSKMKKVEYYFNTDPGFGNGIAVTLPSNINVSNQSLLLNVSTAAPGLNTLCIRAQDSLGGWSITNVFNFIKLKGNVPQNMEAVEYFVDTDPGFGMGASVPVSASPDVNNYSFDADLTGLSDGNHNLFIRTKDAFDNWSLTSIVSFNKTPSGIGVSELNQINLNVYPNPSCDHFTLDAGDNLKIKKIDVIDSKGQVIKSILQPTKKQIIDLSDKSAGIYFIQLTKTDDVVIYQKIIKE